MMATSIAVVGAGIAGSWVSYSLQRSGYAVTLYESQSENHDGSAAASHAASGLLCPDSELDLSAPLIASLGHYGLNAWDALHHHDPSFYFSRQGSLVIVHPMDRNQLQHMSRRLGLCKASDSARLVGPGEIGSLEPELDRVFTEAFFFPDEGQLEARSAWRAVRKAFLAAGGRIHFNSRVELLTPGEVMVSVPTSSHATAFPSGGTHGFDWVFDCRGLLARADLTPLRGVRGERVTLFAPNVTLQRPIRLLHPHHPIYVAPLPDHHFIVGATCIESDAGGAITVRSILELLGSAYRICSELAEAAIVETVTGVRPALADNLPRIFWSEGLTRINGMYRHGYLASPAIAAAVTARLQSSDAVFFPELFINHGAPDEYPDHANPANHDDKNPSEWRKQTSERRAIY